MRQGAEAAAASTGIGAIVSAAIIVGGVTSGFLSWLSNSADEMLKLSEGTSTEYEIVAGIRLHYMFCYPNPGIIIPEDAVLKWVLNTGPAFGFGKRTWTN